MENKTASSDLDGYTRAVVHSVGATYVGYVSPNSHMHLQEAVEIKNAYEFTKGVAGIPNAGPPRPDGQQSVEVIPVPVMEMSYVDWASTAVSLSVHASCIRYFKDMEMDEQRRYAQSIERLERLEQLNRARKAGITLATALPDKLPNGPI